MRRPVATFDSLRLTKLRARLAAARQEKSDLADEIASSATAPERKQQALRRYSIVARTLLKTLDELETFLSETKQAEVPKRFY